MQLVLTKSKALSIFQIALVYVQLDFVSKGHIWMGT